jgi:hypothetical protein
VGIVLGQSITAYDYATIGFQYIGDGSTANYVGIGVTAPTTLCITAGNNVGIGTTNPASQIHIYSTTTDRTNSLYVASKQAGIYLDGTQTGGGANAWNVWVGKTSGDLNPGGLNFFSVNSGGGLNVLALGINGGATLSGALTTTNFACVTLTITASTAYTAINLTSVNGTNLFGTNCRSYIVSVNGTLSSNGTIYMIVLQPSSGTLGNLSGQFVTTPNAITNHLSNSGSANTTGTISSSTIWLYVTDTLGSTYNVTFMRIGI